VVKEADALARAGMEVEVLGMSSLSYLIAEDQELVREKNWKYTAVPGPLDPANRGKTFHYRLSRRLANELAGKTGVQTAAQLGGWRKDLFREALARKADLTIAHSAATLWVARELMQRGRKVAVDFEDWFSREHLQTAWHPNRVITRLEREVLSGASHATCTSEAMAEAIRATYGRKPEVIYNSFPLAEAPQPATDPGPEGPDVLWISQVVGPGRGLELLAGALKQCEPCFQLTLVGDTQKGYEQKLRHLLPNHWRGRVRFQRQVKSSEVLGLVGKSHIGLARERREPESRDLTVTNKILQYLLCGLAVVATRTQGQEEVAQRAGEAVGLVKQGDEKGLAEALTGWARDAEKLRRARQAARRAAEAKFCWEKEEKKVAGLVSQPW
jgi:glycosyltransferase involved in cell wall biosynthesis